MLAQAVVAVTVSEAQVLLNSNCNDSPRFSKSTVRRGQPVKMADWNDVPTAICRFAKCTPTRASRHVFFSRRQRVSALES